MLCAQLPGVGLPGSWFRCVWRLRTWLLSQAGVCSPAAAAAAAAGPLKAKMVSYELQFAPSVSSQPL